MEANPLSSWCGHPLETHGETWLCGLPRGISVDWRNYLINWPFNGLIRYTHMIPVCEVLPLRGLYGDSHTTRKPRSREISLLFKKHISLDEESII